MSRFMDPFSSSWKYQCWILVVNPIKRDRRADWLHFFTPWTGLALLLLLLCSSSDTKFSSKEVVWRQILTVLQNLLCSVTKGNIFLYSLESWANWFRCNKKCAQVKHFLMIISTFKKPLKMLLPGFQQRKLMRPQRGWRHGPFSVQPPQSPLCPSAPESGFVEGTW